MIEHWKACFRHDPDQAIADLFSGRAGLGASMRRDIPEILLHAFPNQAPMAADRERLDTALLGWLNGMRTNYQREVARLDFAVYGKRLCDALKAIQLLDLPRSTEHIREVQAAWLRWLAPLRLAPERDPALECWRLLTLRQQADANPAPWLQLATDSRAEYLTVALLGLQRPETNKQRQVLMVAALLHHYARPTNSVGQNLADFDRHLAVLRGRYPRGPAHWQEVLNTALEGQRGHPQTAAGAALRSALQDAAPKSKLGAAKLHLVPACPSKQEKDEVLRAIADPRQDTEQVARRYLALVDACLRFARQTGDAYFFVRTLCNHGKQLLMRSHLPPQELARIGVLIEDALRWEPANAHTWTFWADWLAYQGREAHQQWVLREAVRIFPDDEASRVELARLLMRQGTQHWPEAERLLREVVNRHPDNGHSHVELARLLAWTERPDKGIALLEKFVARTANNRVANTLLARLRQASPLPVTLDVGELESAAAPSAQSVADQVVPDGALTEVAARGRLQQDYAMAQSDVQAKARLHSAAANGDVLGGLYCQWITPEAVELVPPPHAWAWKAARCFSTAVAAPDWQSLQHDFPEHWETTRFVHWLARPDSEDGALEREIAQRMTHTQQESLDSVQRFAFDAWQRLRDTPPETTAPERKATAFAILHAKALA